MASTSLPSEPENWGDAIDMAAFGEALARRRAALEAATGQPVPAPRNSGANRTPSKRALLEAVDKAAAAKGFRW